MTWGRRRVTRGGRGATLTSLIGERAGGIAGLIADVQTRISAAAERAGRAGRSVRLVTVSKTIPVERIREAIAAGASAFGENYVQEWMAKAGALGDAAIEWHLIGRLQRNKVKFVVGRVALMHGVDSIALLEEIGRRAAAAGVTQNCLLEVNVSGEATKAGFKPDDVESAVMAGRTMPGVAVRGLMTIPPDEPGGSRRWFRALALLRDRVSTTTGVALPDLSMGMSNDYEAAVEEGATIVRVGSAIFGERPPKVVRDN